MAVKDLHVNQCLINTLHAKIIYTSPFIKAEIKMICLRSKWQALLSKPWALPAAGFAKVACNKAGLVYLNCSLPAI